MTALQLTNNLSNLLPIGTLNFYNVPVDINRTSPGKWNWLNLVDLPDHANPILSHLKHLITFRYVMSRYILRNGVYTIRVYAVKEMPELARWRSRKRIGSMKSSWSYLICHLDFSEKGWQGKISLVIDFEYPLEVADLDWHFRRWGRNDIHSRNRREDSTKPPLLRLQEIYNSIESPLSSSSENLSGIPGITSALYPFQSRSISKMHHRETSSEYVLLPNIVNVNSPTLIPFYFDMLEFTVYSKPPQHKLPRGGILAENMGLGKTLICLSLICLTKNDCLAVPEDVLIQEPPKSEGLQSLGDICKKEITQKSLPWRKYRNDLPETVIKQLLESPGSFEIAVHPIRKPSRREQTYKKLFLCTSTLIIVPDNLFHQWSTEIKKHVATEYLQVLLVSSHFKKQIIKQGNTYISELPGAKDLLKYDVIIITSSFMSKQEDSNVLNEVYWKRLIIDEGHSAGLRSKTSLLCRDIMSERRWAVTGTPTTGMTSLQVEEYTVRGSFKVREDLVKLGSLAANFLKIDPFIQNGKYWSNHIIRPFLLLQFGSDRTILNLLNNVVIRHRPEDVNLQLPKLRHTAVFLEPSYHNILSINLFTAVLAVNAVLLERKDIDYMFHPANAVQLRRLVTNLQRATFHWTGFKQEDVETLIDICKESLEKSRNGALVYTGWDRELLLKSLEVSRTALETSQWRTAALLHEMHYFIDRLPNILVSAFSTGILNSNVSIFGAPHLHNVQEFFYKNRFLQDLDKLPDRVVTAAKPFWGKYWKDSPKKDKRFDRQEVTKGDVEVALRQPNGEYERTGSVPPEPTDWEYNTIKKTRVLGTASAKLSYLSSRLLSHQNNQIKSLVFFEFEDSAYYLTELLDILGVNYILYATFISPAMRAKNLSDFTIFDSKKSGGITLIMDLRLASHGLTIIAATHVYFVNPVWQRSVEAQAIKRAHRIGQTKDVHVETLVLKGTLEEEIYKRRSATEEQKIEDEANQKRKYVIDDSGMREYILQHRFLKETSNEYCEFVTEEIKSENYLNGVDINLPSEDSLLNHTSELNGDKRKWTIHLFNNDNLGKFKEKKEKTEFVKQFLEEEVLEERVVKRARKTVKF